MRISDWSSDVCSSDLAFGLERDVVLRVRRRLAVLADIGAQKAPVAGVARPLEVVLVAAVLADRCRRRVHQPHVLDLELAAQRELEPAVEVVDVAAQATGGFAFGDQRLAARVDRSEEHTSELQSLMRISYAVFCLKKK